MMRRKNTLQVFHLVFVAQVSLLNAKVEMLDELQWLPYLLPERQQKVCGQWAWNGCWQTIKKMTMMLPNNRRHARLSETAWIRHGTERWPRESLMPKTAATIEAKYTDAGGRGIVDKVVAGESL